MFRTIALFSAIIMVAVAPALAINWEVNGNVGVLTQRGNSLVGVNVGGSANNYPLYGGYGAGYPFGADLNGGFYAGYYYQPSYLQPAGSFSPYARLAWDVWIYNSADQPILIRPYANNVAVGDVVLQPGQGRWLTNVPLGTLNVEFHRNENGWRRYAGTIITIGSGGGRPELGGNYQVETIIDNYGMGRFGTFNQPPQNYVRWR